MKKLLGLLLLFIWATSSAQTYNASLFTTTNKSLGIAQGVPTDARSYFYDQANFVMRAYQSTAEVLTYLNLPKYRTGQFPIVINTGGSLSNGVITGGINTLYYFKDGVADANLVIMIPTASGGCVGCLLAVNNLADVASPSLSRASLGLTDMAIATTTGAGDLTGTWPNIVVAKFNGQLPSFYLNYNNLFNTPTIPAQVNIIAGSGINVTGSYPNITISAAAGSVGFTTAGVDLIALSTSTVALDTLHYRKVDSLYTTNDSTLIYILNGQLHSLQIRGGVPGTGGSGGTGTVTIVTGVNANGVSFSITNPTSIPAITITLGAITPTTVNGLTLTALATGFTIQGGTTSKTLTVPLNATVSNTNTGDVTLAGETYITISGQVITAAAVNLSGTNATGTLAAGRFPALLGDVTNSVGNLTTTISAGAVTLSKMANLAAHTYIGNNTAISAVPIAVTNTQLTADLLVFTTTNQGLVPAPGSISGKVLSDAHTWVVNGTGNPNSKIGTGYWLVNGSDNTVKTLGLGFGIKLDSLVSGVITITVDTTVIAARGIDSIFVTNLGPVNSASVISLGSVSGDTIKIAKLVAGANVTFTANSDGSYIITAGGSSGGIQNVGVINSQAASANGLVISGTTIYAQYATPSVPGMIQATGSQFIGATITFSAPISISTMTANGGTIYATGTGTFVQGGAGLATQVWHGGAAPAMGPVNMGTDVTGTLPLFNGGNGTNNPVINAGSNIVISGSWGNYTINTIGLGTVLSVSATGNATGMTFTVTNPSTSPNIIMGGDLLPVAGGTGLTSLSPFAPIIGGSTATGAFQQVSGGGGTAGFVLTAVGPTSLPVWAPSTVQTLTATQMAFGSAGNAITSSANMVFDGTNFIQTITTPVAANTVYPSFIAINTAAAPDASHQQYGGAFMSTGRSSGTSIVPLAFRWYTKTYQEPSLGNPSGKLVWEVSKNNAAFTEVGSFDLGSGSGASALFTANNITSNGILISNGAITAALTSKAQGFISGYAEATGTTIMTGGGNQYLNCTSGTFTVSLPSAVAAGITTGYLYTIVNTGTGTITVNAVGGLNIVGLTSSTTYTLSQGQQISVILSVGSPSKWVITSSNNVLGATPTLQQVITAGNLLLGNNIIATGTGFLTFSGTNAVYYQNGLSAQGLTIGASIQTGNATMVLNQSCHLDIDATGGNRTVVLPLGYGITPASGSTGALFSVKKIDGTTNTVTISVTGGGNIDGASTYVLNTQYQSVLMVANSTSGYDIMSTASISGAVTSGTYTPTITNVSNLASGTAVSVTHYIRVGNEISVDGAIICTFTSTSTQTQVGVSFPVVSTITSVNDCLGGVYGASGGTSNGSTNGDITNHRAQLTFNSPSSGGATVYYHFTFTVK